MRRHSPSALWLLGLDPVFFKFILPRTRLHGHHSRSGVGKVSALVVGLETLLAGGKVGSWFDKLNSKFVQAELFQTLGILILLLNLNKASLCDAVIVARTLIKSVNKHEPYQVWAQSLVR